MDCALQCTGFTFSSDTSHGKLAYTSIVYSTLTGNGPPGFHKGASLNPTWGLNLGPSAYKADTLLLSCGPPSSFSHITTADRFSAGNSNTLVALDEKTHAPLIPAAVAIPAILLVGLGNISIYYPKPV